MASQTSQNRQSLKIIKMKKPKIIEESVTQKLMGYLDDNKEELTDEVYVELSNMIKLKHEQATQELYVCGAKYLKPAINHRESESGFVEFNMKTSTKIIVVPKSIYLAILSEIEEEGIFTMNNGVLGTLKSKLLHYNGGRHEEDSDDSDDEDYESSHYKFPLMIIDLGRIGNLDPKTVASEIDEKIVEFLNKHKKGMSARIYNGIAYILDGREVEDEKVEVAKDEETSEEKGKREAKEEVEEKVEVETSEVKEKGREYSFMSLQWIIPVPIESLKKYRKGREKTFRIYVARTGDNNYVIGRDKKTVEDHIDGKCACVSQFITVPIADILSKHCVQMSIFLIEIGDKNFQAMSNAEVVKSEYLGGKMNKDEFYNSTKGNVKFL